MYCFCVGCPAAAALFATGWPYEGDCGPDAPACWRQRDARFWSCIGSAWRAGGAGGATADAPTAGAPGSSGVVRRLPLRTNFSPGCGRAMFQSGRQVSPCAWYNLSLQSLQPLLRVRFVEAGSGSSSSSGGGSSKTDGQPIEIGRSAGSGIASSISAVQGDISDALTFSGGSSLHLSGSLRPGQRAAVQLFEAAVQLPAAGLWVRFTARPSNGVEARLELTLAAAAGGHGGEI